MNKLILTAVFYISIVLESTLFAFLPIFGLVPNTTMILIICYALYYEEKNGAIIGFTAGLIKDMIVGSVMGISALTFMIIGYFVGYYNRKVFAENPTTPFVLAIISTIFHESLYFLVVFLMGYPIHFGMAVSKIYVYQTIYNALLAIPLYFIFNRVIQSKFLRKIY